MRRSILIVMLDVMVLSVLTLNSGDGGLSLPLPVYRWSSLIEEGFEREKEYKDLINQLQTDVDRLAEQADRATALARLGENARSAARDQILLMTQQDRMAERLRNAEERAERAEILADTSAAQRREAVARAQDAATVAEEAKTLVRSAEKTARLAREDRAASEKRAVEFEAIAAQATRAAEAGEVAMRELTTIRAQSGDHLRLVSEAREAQERALQREREVLQRLNSLAAAEAEARERAQSSEEARTTAEAALRELEDELEQVSADFVVLRLREQKTSIQLDKTSKELESTEDQLATILDERAQSIWVRRESAIRRLDVRMLEKGSSQGDSKDTVLYLPLVGVAGTDCMLANFSGLGFGMKWYEDRISQPLSELKFTSARVDSGEIAEITLPIIVPMTEPRVCYVPVARSGGSALQPLGMKALKADRIESAILFKKNSPDWSMKVNITPSVSGDYLAVKPGDLAPRFAMEPGDYLLTSRGDFVGIMVTESRCYVLPPAPPGPEWSKALPLTKESGAKYYVEFVEAANEVRDLIKSLQD